MPYPNDGSLGAYYRHEAGNLLTDASGNGRTLTLTGGCTSVAGLIGNAADFPGGAFGSGAGHLEIPAATVSGVTALSFACWFKIDTLGASDLRPVFAFGDGAGTDYFYFTPAGTSLANSARLVGKKSGTTYQINATGVVFSAATWYFLGAAFSTKGLFLYIGFAPNDFQAFNISTSGNGSSNFATSNLGKHVQNLGPLFDGQIDEAQVYRRQLLEAEFRAIWNNHAGKTYAQVIAIPEVTFAGSDVPSIVGRNTRSLKIAGQTSRIVPAAGRMYPRPE